ncbi:MAG: nucleotide exchange factor GrpE [Acidimicrobiales bacterium]|nr:nucleotide exchange factor GrpE [Acidimicrobiales bacterium]
MSEPSDDGMSEHPEGGGPPADAVSDDASDNVDDPVRPRVEGDPKVSEGAPSSVTEGGDGVEFTPEQIDALVAERDQFLDAYQRTAADFDNFRKLSQKRIADEVTRTQGAFVERLLPVLDAIDAARAQGDGDHAGGVEALAGQLFGFLEKEGLERVDPHGEDFDPNVAEAVVHEPGEEERDQPVVTEVLRTGYLWNGRVIRPAMVKVAG